jgi:hypothetical protein
MNAFIKQIKKLSDDLEKFEKKFEDEIEKLTIMAEKMAEKEKKHGEQKRKV